MPHLMRPEWLWALLPAALLAFLLWRQRGRDGSWHSVIAPELLRHLAGPDSAGRGPNLLPALLAGWVVAVLAASGPSWQKIPQPVLQKQDALVLLLDLSYSMKSADLPPSRIDRARRKLLDLLERRREGQTGLIAYAGDSHIVTPLTDDNPTIANLLPALHPDMMPVPGSDPVAAVEQGLELLRSAGIRRGRLLLVTDGVADDQADSIATLLRADGARLDILGIGTTTGAPIPLPGGGFLKDDQGAIVMPGLQERPLYTLAAASGGQYRQMTIDDTDLDRVLASGPIPAQEQTLALDRSADAWEDQGYLLVLVLLPMVLALFRRGWLAGLACVLWLGQGQPAQALDWTDLWQTPDQQGQRALAAGDAEAAANLFADPQWAGTAAYLQGDYEAATRHFSANESADSLYNRGNALARAGDLDAALDAYRQSLSLQPGRQDALDNIALLEEIKKQQQEQQQEQQQQSGDQQQQQSGQQEQEQQQQPGQQDQQQSGQRDQQQSGQRDQQQSGQRDQQQSGQRDQQQDGQESQPTGEQATGTAEDATGEDGDQAAALAEAEQTDAERERDQAMEQWLRRIPDDPSGLLREKFRYESQQRQRQGAETDEQIPW